MNNGIFGWTEIYPTNSAMPPSYNRGQTIPKVLPCCIGYKVGLIDVLKSVHIREGALLTVVQW